MSAVSPGKRVASKEQSELCIRPLEDAEVRRSLVTLQQLFESSFGPRGRLQLIHNNSGGHVTVTSTSARRLQNLSTSSPLLRLIVAGVQGHLQRCSDGGTMTALLALNLVNTALDLDVHRRLATEIHEVILDDLLQHLQSRTESSCCMTLDVTDITVLRALVKSILTSKPGCLLFGRDLDHLAFLLLDAFLKSGTAADSPIQYLCIEGKAVRDSFLVDGCIFQTPQIATYTRRPLEVPVVGAGARQGQTKVLLVSMSMAGDSEEFPDVTYEISSRSSALTDVVVDALLRMCREAAACGVGLLACQKVVHPKAKKYLKQQSIFVLDRMGLVSFKALHALAGGDVIQSLHVDLASVTFGYLSSVVHKVIEEKSYVHMQGVQPSRSLCTLVLCHHSDEAVQELKVQCEVVQHSLQMTMAEPRALPGGGCWQTHLAHYVTSRVPHYAVLCRDELGSTEHQTRTVALNTARCLNRTAHALDLHGDLDHMTDSANHHHWLCDAALSQDEEEERSNTQLTCQCGAYAASSETKLQLLLEGEPPDASGQAVGERPRRELRECSLLDAYTPCISGLRTAFGIANMVLGIQQCIQDTN